MLVVDDDAAIRELLTDMLGECGYDVREAGDKGQAARYYLLSLQQNPQNDFAKRKLVEMGVKPPVSPLKPDPH